MRPFWPTFCKKMPKTFLYYIYYTILYRARKKNKYKKVFNDFFKKWAKTLKTLGRVRFAGFTKVGQKWAKSGPKSGPKPSNPWESRVSGDEFFEIFRKKSGPKFFWSFLGVFFGNFLVKLEVLNYCKIDANF